MTAPLPALLAAFPPPSPRVDGPRPAISLATASGAMSPAVPSETTGQLLRALLAERFGFNAFRPHQQEVCEAVVEGRDALVVMPTGAGKSLCYQLPGMLRRKQRIGSSGGCVLVVSPLIALMEDQVMKMRERGFVAERIHSGCDREASREVCRQYLRGQVDFLFFAPERLAVPGFPEMLAKKTPALVAVDEAHCISHWGHDFRPEYRMLGERLPLFRPAPILALTATATPVVQDDIVELLRLGVAPSSPAPGSAPMLPSKRFIHGFRRENIALEVVDCAPTQRRALAAKAVADPAHRPAILYAPTRKDAEEIASEFADEGLAVAAYHAGLPAKQREAVQNAFSKGTLEVVVATIAFGMGVDKADVRTVVHLALPQSVESYSQEVGRAGRDGLPSRALCLGSMVDARMHTFFVERDYPTSSTLGRLWRALPEVRAGSGRAGDDGFSEQEVKRQSGLDDDTFPKALEKLWIHGGAIGVGAMWQRGHDRWEAPYLAQKRHKEQQIAGMTRFLDEKACRQLALLRHFGDDDNKGACGICDACDPTGCRLRQTRAVTDDEDRLIAAIASRLVSVGQRGISTGKLFSETLEPKGIDRRSFEHLLAAMVRADRVRLEERVFVNDRGERIKYQSATAGQGNSGGGGGAHGVGGEGRAAALSMFVSARTDDGGKGKGKKPRGAKKERAPRSQGGKGGGSAAQPDAAWASSPRDVVDRLRAWRLAEAQAKKAPAFTVFSDRVLLGMASCAPSSVEDLMKVPGMPKRLLDKRGHELLAVIRGEGSDLE